MVESFMANLKNEWDLLFPELKEIAKKELIKNTFEVDFINKQIINLPKSLGFGIYLFKIIPLKEKFSSKDFEKEWNSKKAPQKTPRISSSRFNKRDDSKSSFNFYIGKSEKLSKRIIEHCFQNIDKTTYGLKLSHRENLIKKAKFTVSYYEIVKPNKHDKNKDIIQFVITNLEKELRKDYSPWIGKQ